MPLRVACFTPLPPRKSGIADYSAALLRRLAERVDLQVFVDQESQVDGLRTRPSEEYLPTDFDITLYQVGNNSDHAYLYRAALEHPGVVALHEFNLHHLAIDVALQCGEWDGYFQEAEHYRGAEGLAYARRVKAREVGPDYENLPMNQRLLQASRALVVHSDYMARQAREVGFSRPVAVIPHGAAILDVNRQARRHQLGVDETTPLVGIFGFLKPYKRVQQALQAFHRLVRVEPRVKMILVGEEHAELPVRRMIATLGLESHVRVLGYVPIQDFVDYIGAVDVCLNLRYPTVGESSGTLLRAMGLGRAVVVSDVGSFSELPDDACLKVPVGDGEVDLIFQYLNLLVNRPEVARALGDNARRYVEEQCSWERVAEQYAEFLGAVTAGREWKQPAVDASRTETATPAAEPAPQASGVPQTADGLAESILGYASGSPEQLEYARRHLTRLVRTLEITPRGGPQDRILEMGAYLQITPALKSLLCYGEVRGSYLGPAGKIDRREARSSSGETFACEIDLFDAERDRFPYPDGHFATVLCCELLEHLRDDPMHMMAEINRILRPRGTLVLSTPNICGLRAIDAILLGYHPGFFHQYIRPSNEEEPEPRHHREYAPREVASLLEQAGFAVTLLETGPFRAEPSASREWVVHLLDRYGLPQELRGEGIYAVGRKVGPVKSRYPAGLYAGGTA